MLWMRQCLAGTRGIAKATEGRLTDATVNTQLHQLKGDLDWIVMKCLQKDRQRRYETATGLAADLKRHLNNEPVLARPPSTAYRFQKAFRRNKLLCATNRFMTHCLRLWSNGRGTDGRR